MKPVILVGHTHECPIHGPGTVTSGAANYFFNGQPVARVGDQTSCAALITTGSATYCVDGEAVAREGDETDHGGLLTGGDAGWLLD